LSTTPPDPRTLPIDPSHGRRLRIGVLLIAAILRAAWALAVPVVPASDSKVYDLLARNLAAGEGYCWEPGQPTAYWPVGPSFIYSLFYRAFGFQYFPIVLFNLALGVGTVDLVMRLARRWFGPSVSYAAGLMVAFWPSQIEFTTALASEQPFVFLMLAGLLAFPGDGHRPWWRPILSGIFLAGASFMRPTALVFPVLLALSDLVRNRRPLASVRDGAIAMLAMAACIAPWTVRNWHVFGEFVPISTNGGPNTWMGNNPQTDGLFMKLPAYVDPLSEVERDRLLAAEASAYIRQYPIRFVGRTLLSNLYWWVALLLGLAGAVQLVSRLGLLHGLFHPTILIWAYFSLTHAITVVQDRYHFPIIPVIAALASYFLTSILAAKGTRDRPDCSPIPEGATAEPTR
jgi:4-amino-4-deoxy-L-arabinose transferase-like glycosyltransferase